ncbi:hypothetical protein JCM10212_003969 [Sporobolomyces blumeae]
MAQSPTTTPVPRLDTHSTRVDVIDTDKGRILCVADVRGALSTLNSLAAEHNASAIIHSGDFGFYEPSSLGSISDRTLKHLVQYSSLITPAFRSQLLSTSTSPTQMRHLLANPPPSAQSSADGSAPLEFALSEFPKLLNGTLELNVPVYTVWGACEDVSILEKIRLAPNSTVSVPSDPSTLPPQAPATSTLPPSSSSPASTSASSYSIPNLTVLDEATSRVLLIGGIRLRLFGLGGAVVPHKLFDNGQGQATIAGGQGTMWTTMLQIGELVYDPAETRLLITHASPGREGLISQLSLVLKADLTVSAGLHFRYGSSYNEFSVLHDPEAYRTKLDASRKAFAEVWDAVKGQVEGVVDENQKLLLNNALAVANRVPATAPVLGGPAAEETAWKNCWNWNLPDAAFGSLVLDIKEGRIGSEMKSQGFNFAYRSNAKPPAPSAAAAPVPASNPSQPQQPASQNSSQQQPGLAPTPQQRPPHFGGPGAGPGRGGIHQRAPSGPRRGGFGGPNGPGGGGHGQGWNAGQQSGAAAVSPSATPVPASAVETKTNEPKVNGSQPAASASTPASNAGQASASAQGPPTGPRSGYQRPASSQSQRSAANPGPAQQQPSTQPGKPDGATASPSTEPATPATGGKKNAGQPQVDAIAAGGEASAKADGTDGAEASSPSSTPAPGGGRGRGRSGRSGRGGANTGAGTPASGEGAAAAGTPAPGGTTGRGARGRSNGEWRGRGGGRGGRGASGSSVGGNVSSGGEATPGGNSGGGGGEKATAA